MKTFLMLLLCVAVAQGQDSRRGTYRAAVEKTGGANRAGEFNSVRVLVADARGTVLTTVKKELPFDVPFPSAGVFESGVVMLVHPFDGLLEFYAPGGTLVRALKPMKESTPEYERIMRYDLHDEFAVLLISEPAMEASVLLTVSDRGEFVQQRDVPSSQAQGVVLSDDGGWVAAGMTRWEGSTLVEETFLYRRNGELQGKVGGMFTRGTFAPDGSRFIGHNPGYVFAVGTVPARLLWKAEAGEERLVVDAQWGDERAVVLTAKAPALINGAWYYTQPAVETRNERGTLIDAKAFPSLGFVSGGLKKRGAALEAEFDGVVYPKK